MDDFFKKNCYPIISLLLFSPSNPSFFCFGFRVDMVSCMRHDFFKIFLLSSLILLPHQLFAYIAAYLMLWKLADLEGWDCSYAATIMLTDKGRHSSSRVS